MSELKPRLNFLLGCSDLDLENFRISRLDAASALRKQILELQDELFNQIMLAELAAWFRENDRQTLKSAIENEESAADWAKRMIRGGHELELAERLGRNPLAHRTANLTYQRRNMAAGKCASCPKPLAYNSVKFCDEHLAKRRVRERTKKNLSDPGGRQYLYAGEVSEDGRGRHPNTLASLAMARVKKTRAVLAELGFPSEHAAVSLIAAKEAALRCLPATKAEALTQTQLFEKACIPTRTTGQKALGELLRAGQIQRFGKGNNGDPYRYFLGSAITPQMR